MDTNPENVRVIEIKLGKPFFRQVTLMKVANQRWFEITGEVADDAVSERLNTMAARYAKQNPKALPDEAIHGFDTELPESVADDVRKLVDDFHSTYDKEPVEILPTVADRYVFSLTKLSGYLFDPRKIYDNVQGVTLQTSANTKIYVYIDPQGAAHLDAEDERVYNAILSVLDKQKGLTTRGYCTLSNLVYAAGLSNCDTNRQFVLDHVRKMNRYFIRIDDREEVAAGLSYTPQSESEGRLIDYKILPVRVHGKVTDQGIYFDEPFLLTYSRRHNNQLSSEKHAVLEYPLKNSGTVVAVSEPLNKHLSWTYRKFASTSKSYAELAKKAKKGDPVDEAKLAQLRKKVSEPIPILFATLYERTGIDASARYAAKRIRDYAEVILTHYASKHLHHVQKVVKGKDRFLVYFEAGIPNDGTMD